MIGGLAIRDGIVKGRRRNSPCLANPNCPRHPRCDCFSSSGNQSETLFCLSTVETPHKRLPAIFYDRAEVGRSTLTNTYRTSLLSSHYLIPKTVQAASCSNLQLATGPFRPGALRPTLVSRWFWGVMLGLRSKSAAMWIVERV